MADIESLYSEAKSLSNADRRRLAELLLRDATVEADADDATVGQRGLHAWTESTMGEDWSDVYPHDLGTPGPSER